MTAGNAFRLFRPDVHRRWCSSASLLPSWLARSEELLAVVSFVNCRHLVDSWNLGLWQVRFLLLCVLCVMFFACWLFKRCK